MKTKYVSLHCIGAVNQDMMVAMLKESGNDEDVVRTRIARLCERPPVKLSNSLGQGLLDVTQPCHGDSLCARIAQATYQYCYSEAYIEGIEAETASTLALMLETCSTFHSKGPACETDAKELMLELRKTVREGRDKAGH